MASYPLLGPQETMAGVLDYRGRPITKGASGRWVAVSFIIGMEMAERVAFNGILFNLVSYMTGPLGVSTAAAAAAITIWSGISMILPILGAFLADSLLSRYRAIIFSALLYILGLGLLSFSALLPSKQQGSREALFYFSIYLVAFGEGGNRPCVQAFGADQFDENDDEERRWRSSFFNLWTFVLAITIMASSMILSYVQDNVSWGLGFGIPCFLMVAGLAGFLLGSRFYRCYTTKMTSTNHQFGQAFVDVVKRKLFSANKSNGTENQISDQIKDEAQSLLPLIPIWATCLLYTIVECQLETFFTKQGATLNRNILSSFRLPPAGLQSLTYLTVSVAIAVYDRLFVPLAASVTGIPTGITKLQRIGVGQFLSVAIMVLSALVESRRLRFAAMVGDTSSTLPMSISWLFPQYILSGFSTIFATVGLQEFFYEEVPDSIKSFGIAVYLSIFGVGYFFNSLLVYATDRVTRSITGESWLPDDLNRGHLDYFYWLIAFLALFSFLLFVYYARRFEYRKKKSEILV